MDTISNKEIRVCLKDILKEILSLTEDVFSLNPSQGHYQGHFVLDDHISYKRTVSRTVL